MSTIIRKSLMNKVNNLTCDLTDKEFCALNAYILYNFMSIAPTKEQEIFTNEIFGAVAWAEYIKFEHTPENKRSYFNYTIKTVSLLNEIRGFLGFYAQMRFEKILNTKSEDNITNLAVKKILKESDKVKTLENKFKVLKKDLKKSINESYDEGIFYKSDAWCNVYDVLARHDLINENDFADIG